MAYYEKVSKNSYRLIVAMGYDSKGKKLRKRKTIKVSETLTPKQLAKELNTQMTLFEKEVLGGNYLDGEKITFQEFVQRWLKDYAEINLTPETLVSYNTKLEKRILPAIGHIKLAKLQPTHLIQFYQNLNEDNIRLDGKYYPKAKLTEFLKPYSASEIEKMAGITFKTCQRLKAGKCTDYKTEYKLSETYNLDIKKMFECECGKKFSEDNPLSYRGNPYNLINCRKMEHY